LVIADADRAGRDAGKMMVGSGRIGAIRDVFGRASRR